jgi:hypothetical protein
MNQALKAALFSAFVFPGSGHFLLKKHIRGVLLAGVTCVCIGVLLSIALEKAQEISFKIQSGEIPPDLSRIMDEVSKLSASGTTQQADMATYILAICWLVGTVDAYRVGWLRNKNRARSKPPS